MTYQDIPRIANYATKADIICEIDGTLMNVEDRLALAIKSKRPDDKKMNWDVFLDPRVMEEYDRPNWDVVFIIRRLMETGSTIIFTSARNERHRDVTESQLRAAGIEFSQLFLRPDGDFRSDDGFKEEVLDALLANDWKPDMVFDDRDQVVAMWRRRGLTCVQVAKGDF